MAFDFKKEYSEFYMPKNKPQIVTVRSADNANTSNIVSCLWCIAVRAWRNFQRLVPLSAITD